MHEFPCFYGNDAHAPTVVPRPFFLAPAKTDAYIIRFSRACARKNLDNNRTCTCAEGGRDTEGEGGGRQWGRFGEREGGGGGGGNMAYKCVLLVRAEGE